MAKKLQAGVEQRQLAVVVHPGPPPSDAPATPPTPAAPTAAGDPLTDPLPEDPGGAARRGARRLGRAPHPSTTPDDPAEVVDLEEGKTKK